MSTLEDTPSMHYPDFEHFKRFAREGNLIPLYREILAKMSGDTENLASYVKLLFLNRFIERLGDHVTGMCEWVIYTEKGEHPELNP